MTARSWPPCRSAAAWMAADSIPIPMEAFSSQGDGTLTSSRKEPYQLRGGTNRQDHGRSQDLHAGQQDEPDHSHHCRVRSRRRNPPATGRPAGRWPRPRRPGTHASGFVHHCGGWKVGQPLGAGASASACPWAALVHCGNLRQFPTRQRPACVPSPHSRRLPVDFHLLFSAVYAHPHAGAAIAAHYAYGIRNYGHLYQRRTVRSGLPGRLHPPQAGRSRFCGSSAALRESNDCIDCGACVPVCPKLDVPVGRGPGGAGSLRGDQRRALQLTRPESWPITGSWRTVLRLRCRERSVRSRFFVWPQFSLVSFRLAIRR